MQLIGHPSYVGQIRNKFQMTLIFVDIPPKMSMKNSLPMDLHWGWIYWSPRKWQNLLNFLQGVQDNCFMDALQWRRLLPNWFWKVRNDHVTFVSVVWYFCSCNVCFSDIVLTQINTLSRHVLGFFPPLWLVSLVGKQWG